MKVIQSFILPLWFFIMVIAQGNGIEDGSKLRNENSRINIINGNETSIENYPFMVSVMAYGTLLGSGVILDNNWVLTTAYNAAYFDTDQLVLRVGSSFYNKSGHVHQVEEIVYPKGYKADNFDWNLALLKVSEPITFGKKVQPVSLAEKDLENGTKVALVGWGPTTTNLTAPPSKFLVTAELTVLDKKTCSNTYELTSRIMCTYDNITVPTAYDWGDPLVINNTVYGLFSRTATDKPALYADIFKMLKWIKKHMTE